MEPVFQDPSANPTIANVGVSPPPKGGSANPSPNPKSGAWSSFIEDQGGLLAIGNAILKYNGLEMKRTAMGEVLKGAITLTLNPNFKP